MLSRFSVVLLAGCASASMQTGGDAPSGGDGPHGGGSDAAPHGDAAVDAAPHIDAPPGSCATPMTGALAVWSFTGAAGNQAQTDPSMTATGVTATAVTRAAGLVAAAGANSINSSMWSMSTTIDPAFYYTFTVTPPTGCAMDLTQLTVDTKSSTTGPHGAAVGTSADAFAATTTIMPTDSAPQNATLSVSGATGATEVRVYGWAATGTAGTMRIQTTLTLTGTLR
jgi:hypothetical protein